MLEKAMNESEKQRFLIDGFPRNEENRSQFEKQVRLPREEGRSSCNPVAATSELI